MAVIGVGHLGFIHAKIYQETKDALLVGVCDTNPARLKEVCEKLKVPGYSDYRLLKDKIDAVSIATPTTSHYQIAKFFLSHKIHCLVEKPFTLRLGQADRLIFLAKKNKTLLQVGHVERFNAVFETTHRIINRPQFIECHRLSPFPNRSLDIGVVLDVMIHDIDIVLGLVEKPITKIEATGVNVLTPFEDIANARIRFADGCIANLTASRVSDELVRKIRIFQQNAYICLDYKEVKAYIYTKKGSSIFKQELPIEKETPPLQKELSSFLKCVKNKMPPLVSGEIAKKALAVALEIQRRIWKKKRS